MLQGLPDHLQEARKNSAVLYRTAQSVKCHDRFYNFPLKLHLLVTARSNKPSATVEVNNEHIKLLFETTCLPTPFQWHPGIPKCTILDSEKAICN